MHGIAVLFRRVEARVKSKLNGMTGKCELHQVIGRFAENRVHIFMHRFYSGERKKHTPHVITMKLHVCVIHLFTLLLQFSLNTEDKIAIRGRQNNGTF